MNWKRILIGKWSWKRPFQSLISIYLILCFIAVFFARRVTRWQRLRSPS